jgi:hypothetical protein
VLPLFCLKLFQGLVVNFNKSMLIGVHATNSWLGEAIMVLNCRTGRIPFVHLGLPLCGDAKRLNFWALLLDRIISISLSWKSKKLSLGGHLILLKFVMSSLSIYFLSFF